MARSISNVALLILPAIFGLLIPLCMAGNILYSPDSLHAGQSLTSGSYSFNMQEDCNLVLYDSGKHVWASGTYKHGNNCYVTMQRDGNLVLYDEDRKALWSSKTSLTFTDHFVCVLQSDRNVVVYGGALWSTHTYTTGHGIVIASNTTSKAVNVDGGAKVNGSIAMVTK